MRHEASNKGPVRGLMQRGTGTGIGPVPLGIPTTIPQIAALRIGVIKGKLGQSFSLGVIRVM